MKKAALALSLFSVALRLLAVVQAGTTGGDDASCLLFTACLVDSGLRNVTMRQSPAYDAALRVSIQNLRFAGPGEPKSRCGGGRPDVAGRAPRRRVARSRGGAAVWPRSGEHSYEGLSYIAADDVDRAAFAVVNLAALAGVRVDAASRTAWVEAGATLGQVYRAVVAACPTTLAFSAGSCPTVGSGGHIAGRGFGLLLRKHGLAADNVLDAGGRVLDRAAMGDDAFWALRGGGWGAVYAWRVRLSVVPPSVTAFVANRASGSAASVARLVSTWQRVAPRLPDEFYLSAFVGAGLPELNPNQTGTISVTFKGLYLVPSHDAVGILATRFPELGLSLPDLNPLEMTWIIESVLFCSGLPKGSTVSDLADRVLHKKKYFKAKSDYVRRATPFHQLVKAIELLSEQPKAYVILDPYGVAMDRVGSGNLPFPHSTGNINGVQYT